MKASNVVTFRDDDGTLIEAQVLEIETRLNGLWLRVDDGSQDGRWIRSDVVEAFTMVNVVNQEPADPTAE